MIRIVIACALVSLATAAVITDDSQAQIVKYTNENDGAGNYEFSFETSNGITREERGRLVNIGQEDEHIVVDGSYSFTDDTGKLVVVRYTADENGFKVEPPTSNEIILLPPVGAAVPAGVVASLLG